MRKRTECTTTGPLVVVTGAAGGIGGAIASWLSQRGYHVLAGDVSWREAGLSDGESGGWRPQERMHLDVTDEDSVRRVVEELVKREAVLSGLVNVAGVLQNVVSLLTPDHDASRRLWEVNYSGAMRCMRLFAPLMRPGASIVNITSVNEHRPLPLHDYAPAKVALGAATRLAAGELGDHSIRVNAVAPGFTLTDALAARVNAGERDLSQIERASALGRLVQPEEVAAVVEFLLGPDSSAITGVSVPVDCGWLATSHWMDYGQRLGDRG